MWLIKASLKNPYMVATIVFMILVLGFMCLARIPFDILPVFKAPAVQVITYYQGMPAASIEKTITNRIERWVNQAPGASLVESKSVPGVSVVRVYLPRRYRSDRGLDDDQPAGAWARCLRCRPTRCRRWCCPSTRPAPCPSAC